MKEGYPGKKVEKANLRWSQGISEDNILALGMEVGSKLKAMAASAQRIVTKVAGYEKLTIFESWKRPVEQSH